MNQTAWPTPRLRLIKGIRVPRYSEPAYWDAYRATIEQAARAADPTKA